MNDKQFYTILADYYEQIFPLNAMQVQFIEAELGSLDELNFLDVGCATGQLANALCADGALGIGIDMDEQMVNRASEQFASVDLLFKQLNMLRIRESFPLQFFDSIICLGNTLVHLDSVMQVQQFFKQVKELLKPGGKFIFQLLNYEYVLNHAIKELPLIETGALRFERSYELPTVKQHRIGFNTRLNLKDTELVFEHSTLLLPLRKNELEKLLTATGFGTLSFYSGFDRRPYADDQLPLIVVAENTPVG